MYYFIIMTHHGLSSIVVTLFWDTCIHSIFNTIIIPPPHDKVVGGYIGFTQYIRPSVRPSIRPASRVRSLVPTVLVGSISYLYILSNVSRETFFANIQKLNFWHFFKICNFDFILFWLGIWCESLVWLNMCWWGVSQNAGILVLFRDCCPKPC